MPRPLRVLLISLGVVAFLVVSALLARFLAAENVERDDVLAVLRDEARGDAPAVLAALHGCAVACQATVRADAAALRGPGPVVILAYMSATAHTLTGATGSTRVAWKLGSRLPSVQCVLVRRSGDALSGIDVTLLAIRAPIALESDC